MFSLGSDLLIYTTTNPDDTVSQASYFTAVIRGPGHR